MTFAVPVLGSAEWNAAFGVYWPTEVRVTTSGVSPSLGCYELTGGRSWQISTWVAPDNPIDIPRPPVPISAIANCFGKQSGGYSVRTYTGSTTCTGKSTVKRWQIYVTADIRYNGAFLRIRDVGGANFFMGFADPYCIGDSQFLSPGWVISFSTNLTPSPSLPHLGYGGVATIAAL